MLNRNAEDVLSRLQVTVDKFAISEIGMGSVVRFAPSEAVAVHFVLEGDGALECRGHRLALSKGAIAVVPAGCEKIVLGRDASQADVDACPVQPGSADWTLECGARTAPNRASGGLIVASATLSASAGYGLDFFEHLNEPIAANSQDLAIGALFDGMIAELASPGIGAKSIVEAMLKQVLIILLRRTMPHLTSSAPLFMTMSDTRLAQVINLIDANPSERFSIPGLALQVGMTSLALTQEFERVFGESLLDYIKGVRFERASTLLRQTDLPVKSIAGLVGFASRSHFSRSFAKRIGEDPTTFRKTYAAA